MNLLSSIASPGNTMQELVGDDLAVYQRQQHRATSQSRQSQCRRPGMIEARHRVTEAGEAAEFGDAVGTSALKVMMEQMAVTGSRFKSEPITLSTSSGGKHGNTQQEMKELSTPIC